MLAFGLGASLRRIMGEWDLGSFATAGAIDAARHDLVAAEATRPRCAPGVATVAAVADGAPAARGVAVAAAVRHVVLAGGAAPTDGAQPRPREAAALGRLSRRRPGRAGGGVSGGASHVHRRK